MFNIHYHKTKHINLTRFEYPHDREKLKEFDTRFEDSSMVNLADSIQNLQLYHPIYKKFFELTPTNYNQVALNHRYHVYDDHHIIDVQGPTLEALTLIDQDVFIKFSPLLDPIKYMVGKYDIFDPKLKHLPTLQSTANDCHEKLLSYSNASYVDGFFYYLTSMIRNHHHFVHGIDFYGSYLGIQDRYKINVEEDLEYLSNSPFFIENVGKYMVLENYSNHDMKSCINYGSRSNRKRVVIEDILPGDVIDLGIIECEGVQEQPAPPFEEECLEMVYNQSSTKDDTEDDSESSNDEASNDEEDEDEASNDEASNDEEDEDEDEDDQGSEDSAWETEESESSLQEVYAYIYDFPVQMICLEKCQGTLDDLFVHGLSVEESASALFQIVMILCAYQKMFRFTHNDLHTNNIMYVATELTHLYYKYNKKTYKVPTYGRIYKIIDYGRSIYKYQKTIFCSDSFAPGGDASTQYNCEPFMKASKPRIDPNMSFDLCRLGSSIYDFVFDDNNVTENAKMKQNELQRTIQRWCTDDNGNNVLYKKNGEERYPGFRLYKMVARTVHKHTPENQLNDPWFKQFLVKESSVAKSHKPDIMDIDSYPVYYDKDV